MIDNFSYEELAIIDTIRTNCKLLIKSTSERIEYVDMVKYPDGSMQREEKSRTVKRPALLEQLRDFAQNKDVDLNPKAARGAPRVKKAKLNPELNGFLTLDEIICDMNSSLDRIFEAADLDRTWLSNAPAFVLHMLDVPAQSMIRDGKTGLAQDIADLTVKWVGMARRTLNQTIAETMFEGVVCGNCKGALAAPNRIVGSNAEVRCVGSMTTPPCGNTYPASEWLALYEGRQK